MSDEGRRTGTLWGVSVGPGDPELITVKALRTIGACPTLAYPVARAGADSLALGIVRAATDVTGHELLEVVLPMSRDEGRLDRAHRLAARTLEARLDAGDDVAFACLGDVSVYSTFSRLAAIATSDGYRVRTVAGVPSFCAAASALGEPLTQTPETQVHVIPARTGDLGAALGLPGCKVVMKAGRDMPDALRALRERDLLGRTALVENCGLPGERVVARLSEGCGDAGDGEGRTGYFATLLVRP